MKGERGRKLQCFVRNGKKVTISTNVKTRFDIFFHFFFGTLLEVEYFLFEIVCGELFIHLNTRLFSPFFFLI